MSAVAKVKYSVGPVPGWFKHDVHRMFLEDRLIETSCGLYGNGITIEFEYDMGKPHKKRLYDHDGHIISVNEYKPVVLLDKVRKDAEERSSKGLKPR